MKINLNYFNELLKHSISVERHAFMAAYTQIKTGGRVAYLVLPKTTEEIILSIQLAIGYSGVILLLKSDFSQIQQKKYNALRTSRNIVKATRIYAYQHQLCGLESSYLLFSSVGGSLMKFKNYENLTFFDSAITCDYLDQQLQYQSILFSSDKVVTPSNSIVLFVTFNLTWANSWQIKNKMKTLYLQKLIHFPSNYPCIGPVFSDLREGSLLTLLQQCHCVGKQRFNVQVSEKQTNYNLNLGHATSFQVEMLIEHIKTEVLKQTSVKLQCILEKVG